jgi:hypothetical protein
MLQATTDATLCFTADAAVKQMSGSVKRRILQSLCIALTLSA